MGLFLLNLYHVINNKLSEEVIAHLTVNLTKENNCQIFTHDVDPAKNWCLSANEQKKEMGSDSTNEVE